MNKRELSIGDWVKVPVLVYDNGLEDFDNGLCRVRDLRDNDLDTYGFKRLSYSEVEPVKITKSILEKMGFVEKEYTKEFRVFEYRKDDFLVMYSMTFGSVDIFKVDGKINEIDESNENEDSKVGMELDLSANIIYVHQLQHLLRIVGRDFDEIEFTGIYEF